MKPDILVVSPMPRGVITALGDDFALHDYFRANDIDKAATLKRAGDRIRGYLSFASRGGADAALMDRTPNLEIISNWGVGFDRIDAEAARKRGVILTNTPDVLTECCADLAMGLVIAVARRVAEGDRYVRAGDWATQGNLRLGTRVNGKALGIVGLGRIGKAVARRAAAFGMRIGYHGRNPQDGVAYDYFDSPAALAEASDFLVLTCPGGPATDNLVSTEVLDALGRDGVLVNVARGSVVDEAALIAALSRKRIAGAALDVFPNEPDVSPDLLAQDNVVVQPHQSSATVETRAAMDALTVENLRLHFAGKPVISPVYALP
jgi:lactate dehydrogenase-like 2-hydroxyacid dehydrogenase